MGQDQVLEQLVKQISSNDIKCVDLTSELFRVIVNGYLLSFWCMMTTENTHGHLTLNSE